MRSGGVMNGAIVSGGENIIQKEEILHAIRSYGIKNAVASVSVPEKVLFPCEEKKHTVALFDYGYKRNIKNSLQKRGATFCCFRR